MKQRRPPDWSARILFGLALASFLLGTWGFYERQLTQGYDRPWLEAAYRSLQMFFMNFEDPQPQKGPGVVLDVARFGAFVTTVWVVIKTLFPQVRQTVRRWLRKPGKSCALILGYDQVGQAICAGLRGQSTEIRMLTAVHPAITPTLEARAWADGVLLIEGDPSDRRVLDRVYASRAERVYISDPDDLAAIDTAVAVKKHLAGTRGDIRVILNDGHMASKMAEATDSGFLGVQGVTWFSLADEGARQLLAQARFDRLAVAKNAPRLHLVIIGCGSQGEAIAIEALLTGWRNALGPLRITVLDRNVAAVEAQIRKRFPAWFIQPDGKAIYPDARPQLDFRKCDAETINFAIDEAVADLQTGVTAWFFATGSGALNLRSSLALHHTMQMRRLDPSPIHVRIPSGHSDDMPDLLGQPLTMASTFGAVDTVVAGSPLLYPDPDEVPRKLHAAYARASIDMGLSKSAEDWKDLSESKRNANRSLFRHALMKLEDFGIASQPSQDGLPSTHPQMGLRLARVDDALDYSKIAAETDPAEWFLPGAAPDQNDIEIAVLIRDSALCEHNRWTVERGLEQFVPTAQPDRSLRDDVRRIHNHMHDWYALEDPGIRRFDVVLLRALLNELGDGRLVTARINRRRVVFLPVLADGIPGGMGVSDIGAEIGVDVTSLHVHLTVAGSKVDPNCATFFANALFDQLDQTRQIPPDRIVFEFMDQPDSQTLALANAIIHELPKHCVAKIAIAPRWNWTASENLSIGFVGHLDLTGYGTDDVLLGRLRQVFMGLWAGQGACTLSTGYAPGADQMAVRAWNSLGLPPPQLVFPYVEHTAEGSLVFHTDNPQRATSDTVFAAAQLSKVGKPLLASGGMGHAAQAATVLEQSDIIVALLDPDRAGKPGGTLETVRKAKSLGKKVVVLKPAGMDHYDSASE